MTDLLKSLLIVGVIGVGVLSFVGGYKLGKKDAAADLVDALQSTCGRQETIMQFPDGSMAACFPLQHAPQIEEKFLRRGLDKALEA